MKMLLCVLFHHFDISLDAEDGPVVAEMHILLFESHSIRFRCRTRVPNLILPNTESKADSESEGSNEGGCRNSGGSDEESEKSGKNSSSGGSQQLQTAAVTLAC